MGFEESTYPLATIPWLPSPTCNLRLQDSAVFINRDTSYVDFRYQEELEKLMDSEFEVDRARMSMRDFNVFNRAFPFYIPLSHHTMSVHGIRETGPEGKYWKVAAHFLHSNKALGPLMWNNDIKIGSENCESKMTSQNMKGSMPQCRRPEDFLFEPWILIQLPFQPVLLHQWLTAVYVEVLIFEMEMSEFYNYPFPGQFKIAVNELDVTLKTLKGNLGFGFDWLQNQTEGGDNEIFVGDLVEFSNMLKETLAFLEFRFSAGRKVIRALKKLCWSASHSHSNFVELEKTKTAFDERNFLYNLNSWREAEDVRFGNSSEILEPYETDMHPKLQGNNTYSAHFRSDIVVGNLIRNFSPRIDIVFFTFDPYCCQLVQNLRDRENATSLLMIRKEENGILGTILYNKMKVELVDACDKLGGYLCKVSKNPPTNFFENKYGDAHDLNLDQIMSALSKMHKTENWRVENLLREAKDTILESDPCCPEGPEQIATSFEMRIKNAVFETIAGHYKIKNFEVEKDEMLREWQIGQYLLPCFVASFLDLCAETSVEESTKEWYVRFIDELISTYEKNGFSRSSDACIMMDVEQNLALYMSFNYDHPSMLVRHFWRISRALFAEVKGDAVIAMQKSLMRINEDLYQSAGDQSSSDPPIFWQWLLHDFFMRVKEALVATASSALKAPIPYEEQKYEIIDLIRLISVDATCSYAVFEIDPDPVKLLRHVLGFSFERMNEQIASGLQMKSLPKKFTLEVDESAFQAEVEKLSEKQILSLAFFLAMKLSKRVVFQGATETQKPLFGKFDTAFHSYLTAGNMWAFKEFACDFFGSENRVLADFARSIAPMCYFLALKEFGCDGLEATCVPKDYWYFPIKHCRGCGKANATEFRVCSKCETNAKYPTVNHFCSEQCNVTALSNSHNYEHDQFLCHQIGQNILY